MISFTRRDDYNYPYAVSEGSTVIGLSERNARWLMRRLRDALDRGELSEKLRESKIEVANLAAEVKRLRRKEPKR